VSRHPLLLSAREPPIIGLICGKIGGSFLERDLYTHNLTPCLVTPLLFAVSSAKEPRITGLICGNIGGSFVKKLTPTLSKESSPLQVSFHKRTTNYMAHSRNYWRLICEKNMNLLHPLHSTPFLVKYQENVGGSFLSEYRRLFLRKETETSWTHSTRLHFSSLSFSLLSLSAKEPLFSTAEK